MTIFMTLIDAISSTVVFTMYSVAVFVVFLRVVLRLQAQYMVCLWDDIPAVQNCRFISKGKRFYNT